MMKKSFFFAGLAAALSLVGCNKETDVKGLDGRPVEIVLSDVATRTVNDGMSTKWENGDALNVFVAPAGSAEYSANTKFEVDDAANNHAKGTAELTADAYDWYLLYPYSSYIKTPANTGSGYIPIGSKSNEKQTQAGLNSMAHLSGENLPVYGVAKNVARDETPVVSMKHVASVVAINLTNATSTALKVDEVSFTASQDIVGTYYIDFSQETLAFKGSGNNYVSNTASLTVSGDETIAAGASAKFYLAIKPFTAKGQDKLVVKVHSGELVFEKEVTLPTAVEFKSGVIKQLNVTYTGGSETQSSTLAEIAAMDNGADVQTNEVLVVAKYARGIMLAENGSYLLAFNNNGVTGEIGDIVTVSGKVGEYAGLKQIASPEVTVVSSGNEVVLPAPKVIANLDDYASDKVELIQFTGTLAASDKYFNVNVNGSTRKGSIQYPLDTDALKALDNKPITATGFFTGITGSSTEYVNMMSTSVEEASVALFGVESEEINVPATATSADIKVTGNVDWTVTPGDGILSVEPISGTGAGTVKVTFAANTTAEPKEYSVTIGTTADVEDDEKFVTIIQAKADVVDENDAVFVFGEMDLTNETAYTETPFTNNGVSVQFGGGGNNGKYYNTGNGIRIYANGTITISSQNTITKIAYVFQETTGTSGSGSNQITFNTYPIADDWTVNSGAFTYGANSEWTGASASVVLTRADGKGHWRLQKVIVTCDDTPAPAASLSSISVSGQKKEFNVGDEFTHDTAVVTATYSDNSTKDVTAAATFSTPDMTTAGTKEVTVSYTEGDVTKTAKYDITVNAAATHAGTADDPLTASEARNLALSGDTGSYYISGIVTKVQNQYSANYGTANFWIDENGESQAVFEGYKIKYFDNKDWVKGNAEIAIGDEVIIYGTLTVYTSGSTTTPETSSGYLVSLNGKTKGLTPGTLTATPDSGNKQITVTWGEATGTDSAINYVVSCGEQSYNSTAAGSHTFTMTDYGIYKVSVLASASDAVSAELNANITLSDPTATEKTYTIQWGEEYNSAKIGSYTASWSVTCGGFTCNMANWNNNNNAWNYVKAGRKGNASVATIITAAAIPEAIKTVILTIDAITSSNVNSVKLYTSADGSSWSEAGTFNKATGDQSIAISSPATNLYYKIEADCASGSSNGLIQVSKIVFTTN